MSEQYQTSRYVMNSAALTPNGDPTLFDRQLVIGTFAIEAYIVAFSFHSNLVNADDAAPLHSALALSNQLQLPLNSPTIFECHACAPRNPATGPTNTITESTYYTFPELGLYASPGIDVGLYVSGLAASGLSVFSAVISWLNPKDAFRRLRFIRDRYIPRPR